MALHSFFGNRVGGGGKIGLPTPNPLPVLKPEPFTFNRYPRPQGVPLPVVEQTPEGRTVADPSMRRRFPGKGVRLRIGPGAVDHFTATPGNIRAEILRGAAPLPTVEYAPETARDRPYDPGSLASAPGEVVAGGALIPVSASEPEASATKPGTQSGFERVLFVAAAVFTIFAVLKR